MAFNAELIVSQRVGDRVSGVLEMALFGIL